jgi:Mn-dependent DtxR family transcriptional regulator
VRLAEGLPLDVLSRAGARGAKRLAADGLLALDGGRAVLTGEGRRKADAVVRDLTD